MNDAFHNVEKQPKITEYPNLTPKWLPGQSGNPAGRPKLPITTLLKEKDPRPLADKLYQMACKGDIKAIDVILDRIEGKVVGDMAGQAPPVFYVTYIEKVPFRELGEQVQVIEGEVKELPTGSGDSAVTVNGEGEE